jgi:hypothetical protein
MTLLVERERVRRGCTLETSWWLFKAARGFDSPSCCDYGVGSDKGGSCNSFGGKVDAASEERERDEEIEDEEQVKRSLAQCQR